MPQHYKEHLCGGPASRASGSPSPLSKECFVGNRDLEYCDGCGDYHYVNDGCWRDELPQRLATLQAALEKIQKYQCNWPQCPGCCSVQAQIAEDALSEIQ